MSFKYKDNSIIKAKSKIPLIKSGDCVIGEIHGDYVAFDPEMEFSFGELENIVFLLKLYKEKK